VKSANCWFSDDRELLAQWFNHDPTCTKYWVNLHEINLKCLEQITESASQIVFYDWTHAGPKMPTYWTNMVEYANNKCDTIWYTVNQLPMDNLPVKKFDFYWNRCKSNHAQGPWQIRYKCTGEEWPHYPLHWRPRTHKYLSLIRTTNTYRDQLHEFLDSFKGFSGNKTKGHILGSDIGTEKDLLDGVNVPPARNYFDNSYVSCQVESQHLTGGSIVISEKTYDHLIQGRLVLNFGPQYFYRTLQQQGWKLWQGIDLAWDSVEDNAVRWQGYVDTLKHTLELSMADLHDLFLLNKYNLEHNWQMLYDKPYDILN